MATLTSPQQFSPVEDAENIKKACLGWGTDEKAIISILGRRNVFQRKLIRLAYEEIYQEDLIHQLESELSGDFEEAICLWILDPADRDAVLANTALNKAFPDYRVILEIACIRSPEDLLAVKRAYKFRYKRSLEEDVASHTTSHLRSLLVAVTSSYRYDGHEIDEALAESEARVLREEIQGNDHDKHGELIKILSTRSKAQLKATFNRYRDLHAASVTKGLSKDQTSDYLYALRTVIRCIREPQKYYAKVLRGALSRVESDEGDLSRVILTRAEKDLREIMELFHKRNDLTLDQAVDKEASGDYKTFLLTLLGSGEEIF